MVTKAARSAAVRSIVRLPSGIFFGVSRLPAGFGWTTVASGLLLELHGRFEPLSFMNDEVNLAGSKEDGPGRSWYDGGC